MHDLRSFLDELGSRLVRVEAAVDPLTQLGYLCSESGGPVLFDRLAGFPGWRCCDVLVKTRDSQALALGCAPHEVVRHLAGGLLRGPGRTRRVADGPCKQVRLLGDRADVTRLPIPVHSQGDAGRYIGSGLTLTRDPDTGQRNVAMIRALVKGPRRLAFWMAARQSWAQLRKDLERGRPAPMAYAIGVHPAYEIAANYSGRHEGYDELALGAGLLGEELDLVECETLPLEVPAHAELVIEGWVHPTAREPEGPFGEFTTYRSGAEGPAPVWEITAITHRRDPIFRHVQSTRFTDHQALVCLPMEATLFARLREVQGDGGVVDVHVPPWAGQFLVVVQLDAQWDGQAAGVLLAALSSPNLHPKIAVAVDTDVDPYDAREVLWAIACRVDPQTDVTMLARQRVHPLDLSVPAVGNEYTVMRVGGKLAIDATKPARWRREERDRFARVQPVGHGDATLEEILRLLRPPR